MSDSPKVSVATTECFKLGEGPVWDAANQRILWVDILGMTAYEGHLNSNKVVTDKAHKFDSMVGAVAPANDGGLLVATHTDLVHVDTQDNRTIFSTVITAPELRRTNDGAVDPFGNFLIGTLSLKGNANEESLFRIKSDGEQEILSSRLSLSNGLGWDPTGTIFYNVDTLIGCIWQRPYGPTKVDIGIPKLLIKFDNEYPDGMCVDSQGFLWVAIWGKGQVRRFSAMGELISTINIPAPHVSSVAFVGQELNLLLVTTATKDLSEKQLADFPDSGKLFICEPGVKGLLGTTWRR